MSQNSKVSRRSILKGIGLGVVGLSFGSRLGIKPTLAQAAQPEKMPASAIYRMQLGQMEVIVMQDGVSVFEPANFAVNAKPEELEKVFKDNSLPIGPINTTINVTVVRSGKEVILLDSGAYKFSLDPAAPPMGGRLFASLEMAGIKAEDVTSVILTHFHPDHVAGLSENGQAFFPNAAFYMPEPEKQFLDNAPTGTPFDALFQLAKDKIAPYADRMKLFKPDGEIISGVQSMFLPGHTPGHVGVMFESDGKQLLHMVDVANNAVISLANPDWAFGFDADPKMASETRRKTLEMASSKAMQVMTSHFPFPGVGYIDTDGEGFRYIPQA